jgi:uncharacterized membrane protein
MKKQYLSYADRLKNPRWQKKRLKVMERDGWTCCECHRDDLTLNVHHRFYKRVSNPWDYEMCWLETLCERCHERREEVTEILHAALLSASTGELLTWAQRIGKELKRPRKLLAKQSKINAALNALPTPRFVPPAGGKSAWDQMRAAANGLLAIQGARE